MANEPRPGMEYIQRKRLCQLVRSRQQVNDSATGRRCGCIHRSLQARCVLRVHPQLHRTVFSCTASSGKHSHSTQQQHQRRQQRRIDVRYE